MKIFANNTCKTSNFKVLLKQCMSPTGLNIFQIGNIPARIDQRIQNRNFCPPLSRKRGDIKSHSSIRPSVRLSVTKTLTLAITFALLQVELSYLACVFFVTRPFRWYHVVTLTVTFDLLKGQICCRAGDHNSLNLLVMYYVEMKSYT